MGIHAVFVEAEEQEQIDFVEIGRLMRHSTYEIPSATLQKSLLPSAQRILEILPLRVQISSQTRESSHRIDSVPERIESKYGTSAPIPIPMPKK